MEREITNKILKWLRENKYYCEKIHGGGVQCSGIPDIIACINGRFIGIEVKYGKNKASILQAYKLAQINKSGGIGIVVYSLLDLQTQLKKRGII